MGLSWVERTYLRFGWSRLEKKVPQIKRWLPVIGSGVLAVSVLLRVLGYGEVASAVESVGGAVGVTQQSPVGVGELVAAVAAVTGIVLKIKSQIAKAKAAPAVVVK